MITYEYPLNEKIRTLLRLEDLYERLAFFLEHDDARAHHVALTLLFDIVDVATRGDLKSELLQELERQRAVLEALRHNPAVSERSLHSVLAEMEGTTSVLLGSAGKFAQHVRDSEWLSLVRQRGSLPGGLCEFDLPSYHYWLHLPPDRRRADLNAWLEPMLPIYRALCIVLKLLRQSADPVSAQARHGVYQQGPAGRVAQMVRIQVPKDCACVPEISANKYALNVRFLHPGRDERTQVYEHDVSFSLTLCNL